jgi:hypothetical protein
VRRRELLVVTGLPGGDRSKAPHVEEPPQLVVTGRVVPSIHRLVILAKKLLMLLSTGQFD